MARTSASCPAQAGFTLVEMLVALTLMALVAAMLFGGLRFGARSWEAVVERGGQRDAVAAAHNFLRQRLSQVEGATDGAEGFEGAADRVAFTAPWRDGPVEEGLYRFALSLDDGRLMASWSGVRGGSTEARALLDGVTSLSFAYFGATDSGDGAPVWRSEWPASPRSPRLVRLVVEFEDAARRWPPLVVRQW